jgi:hypothetical protein
MDRGLFDRGRRAQPPISLVAKEGILDTKARVYLQPSGAADARTYAHARTWMGVM